MTTDLSFVYDRQRLYFPVEEAPSELVGTLQKIVRHASALLEAHNCSLALLDTTGTSLVTMASYLLDEQAVPHVRFRLGEGIAGWVAEELRGVVIKHAEQDPRYKRIGNEQIGSMVCVPLINDEQFIGTLTTTSPQTGAFSEKHLDMLTILGEQAVLAIVNARQAERARQQARQLETLVQLAQGITARLDAEGLYRTLLANARQLVTCTQAVMYLYQESSQELQPGAVWIGDEASIVSEDDIIIMRQQKARSTEPLIEKIHLEGSDALPAWAVAHRHPMVYASPPKQQEITEQTEDEGSAQAEIAVPLISKAELYGVLSLKRAQAFSSEELRLVRNLSDMAAVALENVSLFQRIRIDQEQLHEATRSKGKFLSMITHELRSPLNAINGYLDLALTGVAGNLNAQQHEFIQRARSGSEHLFALVEDLLLVSRADAGQLRLHCEIMSLQDVVVNAIEELELTAKDHNITIVTRMDEDLPPLYADAVRLQQVLRNLLSNALRFTQEGGTITLVAEIEQVRSDLLDEEEPQRILHLSVSDTGCGIAPEYQERIFERFFQAPNKESGRAGGQGLGLAIVKMIVELHGGSITVKSEPGRGSTFLCSIPAV